MSDPNPYTSPHEDPDPGDKRQRDDPTLSARLLWLVVPTFLGAVAGELILAPYVNNPKDPGGHFIGAGLGGFAGLAIGFVVGGRVGRR